MRGVFRFELIAALSFGCAPAPAPATSPVTAPSAESSAAAPAGSASNSAAPAASVLLPEPMPPSPPASAEERLARHRDAFRSPRHRPKALDEAARPTRLTPGPYSCRVSREYRLRDCTVERDAEGRTLLEFAEGNLIGMRGVVTDAGGALEFEGWLTEEQPFGCSHCADRCVEDPSSCSCDELPEAAVVECVAQPLRVTLRPSAAGRYRGSMSYRVFYNEYVGEGPARRPQGFVAKEERFEIDLVPGAASKASPSRHSTTTPVLDRAR